MKNKENLKELTIQELEEKCNHFKEELFSLRFQSVTGQPSKPSRIQVVKRSIAQVMTRISQLNHETTFGRLKAEYESMIKSSGIDPMKTPLKTKITMLKEQLARKARKVNTTIRTDIDSKVAGLVKTIQGQISEKLKTVKKGKQETDLRAASRRLRTPGFKMHKKFLDKLSALGLNEASQIASLKETKRTKLDELAQIRTLQRELSVGRLPF